MHAALVTYQFQPGKMEEAVAMWRELLPPLVRQRHGFKGAYLLRGAGPDKALAIGLWETKADSESGVNSEAFQGFRAKLTPFLAGQPLRDECEVLGQA